MLIMFIKNLNLDSVMGLSLENLVFEPVDVAEFQRLERFWKKNRRLNNRTSYARLSNPFMKRISSDIIVVRIANPKMAPVDFLTICHQN